MNESEGVSMIKTVLNASINIMIIILFFILVSILSMTFLKHRQAFVSSDAASTECLSYFTGKPVSKAQDDTNIMEATYLNLSDLTSLNGISNADIIFEYLDGHGRTTYKAIFHDKIPTKIHPILDLKHSKNNTIPKFKFFPEGKLPKTFNKEALSVFITFTQDISSNFVYYRGQYFHFKDTYKDVDKNNNSAVSVSNIIVQFIDQGSSKPVEFSRISGNGIGIVFSGGKAMDIEWNKEENKIIQISDAKGNRISLQQGRTWWIIIDKEASVAYN